MGFFLDIGNVDVNADISTNTLQKWLSASLCVDFDHKAYMVYLTVLHVLHGLQQILFCMTSCRNRRQNSLAR